MRIRLICCFILLFIAACMVPVRQSLEGDVVAITDGDTLTLLTADQQQVKIRLSQVDTPERGQPYATRSKQALSDLAFGKQVKVAVVDIDRYGRTVGRVFVGQVDISAELVSSGAAWVYRRYATDERLYALEETAREQQRGLWGLPESQRVPPWEWRRAKREQGSAKSTQPGESSQQCGDKKYCSQMSSCDEAMRYLEQCSMTDLDKDGDGIPCEWGVCRSQD